MMLNRRKVIGGIGGAAIAAAAGAQLIDQSKRMTELFTSPNQATNSDFAFWGDHAFSGYYTGDASHSASTLRRSSPGLSSG